MQNAEFLVKTRQIIFQSGVTGFSGFCPSFFLWQFCKSQSAMPEFRTNPHASWDTAPVWYNPSCRAGAASNPSHLLLSKQCSFSKGSPLYFVLADICTDACPASQNLIGEGMLVFLTFQVLIEIHDPDRESKALFGNRIPFHTAPNSAFCILHSAL